MSVQYIATVETDPAANAGQAGSLTVTPLDNGSGNPTAVGGSSAGTPHETSTPGWYSCIITYPATPVIPWCHFSFTATGVKMDDPSPQLVGVPAVNVQQWLGVAAHAAVAGYPDVNLVYQGGVATTATAQAGGVNTITLASSEPATDNIFQYCFLGIVSGTGAFQTGLILSYNGSTKVATVACQGSPSGHWFVQPDATSVYQIGGSAVMQGSFVAGQANDFIIALLDVAGNPYTQAAGTITVTRDLVVTPGGSVTTGAAAGTVSQIGSTNRYRFAGSIADWSGVNATFTFTGSGGGQTVGAPATWSVNTTY